jgi:uncharacterized protein with FMN-binding domain
MKTIALSLVIGSAAGFSLAAPELPVPASLLIVPSGSTEPLLTTIVAVALADGTYTGPSIDAYYGLVQVQAVVQSGQIVGLKMLHYPSDRRESLIISQQALPLLRDEVVRTQSAKVDVVSGATLTSQAFVKSLGVALGQAGPPGSNSPSQKPGTAGKTNNSIGI